MKFLLMIHMNPAAVDALTEEDRQVLWDEHGRFQKDMIESGEMVLTQALADPSNSRMVRVHDGVPAVTDGPFLEAKEHLAGFYIIDCDSVERATELAARMPEARLNGVEVRQVMYENGVEM
jgi:hypothetical protein